MTAGEDFDAFVAIVQAESISEAARVLGVPRATLSRKLARLENRLGVRLINRSTRRMNLTRAGQALYPRARAIVDDAEAAVAAVRRFDDVPRGLLRVSAPPTATARLGVLVSAFMRAYPHVEVELHTSNRHVDLAADQFDVVLRAGRIQDANLIARTLHRTDAFPVAAPAYLDRYGMPGSPEALADHVCLRGCSAGDRPTQAWPLREGGEVPVSGPFVTNDLMALFGAAKEGLGIAMFPASLTAEAIETGGLIPVLRDEIGMTVRFSLVWLERAFVAPRVRAFVDFASDWLGDPDPT